MSLQQHCHYVLRLQWSPISQCTKGKSMPNAWSVVAQLIVPKSQFTSIQIFTHFFFLWMGSKDWLKKDKGTFCSRPTSPHWYFAEPSLELTFFLNKFCATLYSLSAQCDMMLVRESPAASPHAAGYPSLTLLSWGGTIKSQFATANMYLRGANQPLCRGRLVFNYGAFPQTTVFINVCV